MLDESLKAQLISYFEMIVDPVILSANLDNSEKSTEMKSFLSEVAKLTDKIRFVENSSSNSAPQHLPSFFIANPQKNIRINFAMIPLGHEFTSFVLAVLQVGGHPLKLDAEKIEAIKNISDDLDFVTYASLECQNCPDIIQAINIMSVINPKISSTAVDGALFLEEVEARNITSIPTVYLNGKQFSQGRMNVDDILARLGAVDISKVVAEFNSKEVFDVLVIGAGPSGSSAAIYSARKGIRTGIIADRLGGQILETLEIENFISTIKTEGPKLAHAIEEHVKNYKNIDIMVPYRAASVEKKDDIFHVTLENGAILKSKTIIISTGATWRKLGVEGEEEYFRRGVAFCPHCDGPLFKGKDVAIIGGGNSSFEGAIDLAGIVNHVTIVGYSAELKADKFLQNKVATLKNVRVIKSATVSKVIGDGNKVTAIEYLDATTSETKKIDLNGIFIQIGLIPNTKWLKTIVETNKRGEIIIDEKCHTSIEGIFASGDVTTVPYKQIIISMGEGAKAAISAFNYLSQK